MNKQKFFDAIRSYINANGIEPRARFVNNNLNITIESATGERHQLAIQGRNSGTGYVTIERHFGGAMTPVACELPFAQGGYFNTDEAVYCLLAIVQDKARKQTEAAANTAETRRRELSTEDRNAIYGATGGGEAYCLAIERAETETRTEELSRVFAGHPPTRADVMDDAETDWLATFI